MIKQLGHIRFHYQIFNKIRPKTFYEVLEVDPRASQKEIKASYFKLVKVYHPDHNKNENAETTFKEIVKAYEVLKDPIKKQIYDTDHRNIDEAGQGFNAGGGSSESDNYYEKRQGGKQFYENRWYGYQKPSYETQHEELKERYLRKCMIKREKVLGI